MTTEFPFLLPTRFHEHLPPAAGDGYTYIDVCVEGKWDGVLVVDSEHRCVGARAQRRVIEHELDFDPDDIEGVRPMCLANRIWSSIPFDPFTGGLLFIAFGSPVFLALAALVHVVFAVVAVMGCPPAIAALYSVRGFILIRLPMALAGVCQTLLGVTWLLRAAV